MHLDIEGEFAEKIVIKACRVGEAGNNGKFLGWQAMIYNPSDKRIHIPPYSAPWGPGILTSAMSGNKAYSTAQEALDAYATSPRTNGGLAGLQH